MTADDLSRLRIDEGARGGSSHSGKPAVRWLRWIALCLVVATVVWTLHRSGLLSSPAVVRSVKASRAYPSRGLTSLNAAGYVVAQRKAAVSSKATGRLAELRVEEGKAVKKGDIIATLENEDLKASLAEAEAALRVAQANEKNADARFVEASLEYNRQRQLRRSGAISAQTFDSVEAQYKQAVASRNSARFEVDRARAALELAKARLDYSYIRAPFDGVILTKNAEVGEVVAPFGGALNAKAAVVTMADMDSLLVEVDVSESSLEKVKVGSPCEIRLDALPNERFPGTVHMIVPTADRSKATVLTKVKFDRLDPRVLPEMSAKVAFLSRPLRPDELKPVLALPRSAIRNSPEAKIVFVIKGGKVQEKRVVTGRQWGDLVEILGGIKEGDRVVLRPQPDLADGDRIKVLE